MKNYLPAKAAFPGLAVLALTGCTGRAPAGCQGYLECGIVHLSSPLAGRLDNLTVQTGAHVTAAKQRFSLGQGAELAALREAAERVRSAQARLSDLRKGQRPS